MTIRWKNWVYKVTWFEEKNEWIVRDMKKEVRCEKL